MIRISKSLVSLIAVLSVPCLLRSQGGFSGPGNYEITNLKSGKVLDLDRNDQTTVIQFSSRGTDNQVWIVSQADSGFYYLRNAMNGNALDISGDRNSSPVRATPFSSAANQQWRIDNGKDGNALIVNRMGKSLDIPDGSNRDGLRVQIYDLNGDSNQRFTFRMVSGQYGSSWSRSNTTGAAQRVTCSSNNGSRVYCNADTTGSVRMVRQISGSACRQGDTWGYDTRGIWVDRGCRAEFETTSASGNVWRRGMQRLRTTGTTTTINCSSNSGGRVHCDANTSGGVRLVRQISGSACTEGSTWGSDSTGVWVDRGCRAEFEVTR